MAKQFTLQRSERLKSSKRIEELFQGGRSFSVPPFRAYYLRQQGVTPGPALQCGFGVSARNFKRAVDRNRIKRLMKEAYRLQKKPLADALAVNQQQLSLFLIYTGRDLPQAAMVAEKINMILNRLQRPQEPDAGTRDRVRR